MKCHLCNKEITKTYYVMEDKKVELYSDNTTKTITILNSSVFCTIRCMSNYKRSLD